MFLLAQHHHVIKWSKDRMKSFTDIKHEVWSSSVLYNYVSAHVWPTCHEKQSWHFFYYFQNQDGFKGTDLLATMKGFTSLNTNYSSSQTKTQWSCHSTQHQVCFHVTPFWHHLEGQDYKMAAGLSQDYTITEVLAGRHLWRSLVQLRNVEQICPHRSTVALCNQALNPSRLYSLHY